jgi:hypothetical protein
MTLINPYVHIISLMFRVALYVATVRLVNPIERTGMAQSVARLRCPLAFGNTPLWDLEDARRLLLVSAIVS